MLRVLSFLGAAGHTPCPSVMQPTGGDRVARQMGGQPPKRLFADTNIYSNETPEVSGSFPGMRMRRLGGAGAGQVGAKGVPDRLRGGFGAGTCCRVTGRQEPVTDVQFEQAVELGCG